MLSTKLESKIDMFQFLYFGVDRLWMENSININYLIIYLYAFTLFFIITKMTVCSIWNWVHYFFVHSLHLRCPLNRLEIFSRKLFWGAMSPFLFATRLITEVVMFQFVGNRIVAIPRSLGPGINACDQLLTYFQPQQLLIGFIFNVTKNSPKSSLKKELH